MMTQLFLTMPQPGETIAEGTIVSWLIKPGDQIQEAQPVAELETEKAIFEYESPFEGKVVKILHGEGVRVPVAQPIAVVECDTAKAELYKMMGIGKEAGDVSDLPSAENKTVSPKASEEKVQHVANVVSEPVSLVGAVVKMSPYVRKLAIQNSISESVLETLANSDGRVTKQSIEDYVKSGAKPSKSVGASFKAPAPQAVSTEAYRVESCSAIRMRIADNMVKSKQEIPHAHNGIAVDITRVVEFRESSKDNFKKKNGANLNLLSVIYPVLVAAIQKHPMINASYDNTTNPHQIKYYNHINLGVAVGSEHGLVIPVIHNVESLSFKEFNQQLADKLAKAQARKLMPQDLQGATLIFNNFGFFGTQLGVQVIQHPMAATLGMGTIEKRVVPVNDGTAIGIRTMTDFVLSFDHRIMDGRETGMFLKFLKEGIEGLSFDHVI